jgi:hypothetical protein
MKQPIPHCGTAPLRAGDHVQIVPEWRDPGDAQYERLVIEAPPDSTRVLVQTLIPGFQIQPVEWIEANNLILLPHITKQPTTPI